MDNKSEGNCIMSLIDDYKSGKRFGIDWKAPTHQFMNGLAEMVVADESKANTSVANSQQAVNTANNSNNIAVEANKRSQQALSNSQSALLNTDMAIDKSNKAVGDVKEIQSQLYGDGAEYRGQTTVTRFNRPIPLFDGDSKANDLVINPFTRQPERVIEVLYAIAGICRDPVTVERYRERNITVAQYRAKHISVFDWRYRANALLPREPLTVAGYRAKPLTVLQYRAKHISVFDFRNKANFSLFFSKNGKHL
jgi:hypothetical protein